MILPIYAYGHPILKKVCKEIDKDFPKLDEFLANLWETMYKTEGVGIAAPQVGKAIRLFVVDTLQMTDYDEFKRSGEVGVKQVFINAEIIEESGKPWVYEEGCLSIPDVRGDVKRLPQVRVRYLDENFEEHDEIFQGVTGRVIQHEYDHTEGILFTELLSPIRKRLVKRKLQDIAKGQLRRQRYKMKFG